MIDTIIPRWKICKITRAQAKVGSFVFSVSNQNTNQLPWSLVIGGYWLLTSNQLVGKLGQVTTFSNKTTCLLTSHKALEGFIMQTDTVSCRRVYAWLQSSEDNKRFRMKFIRCLLVQLYSPSIIPRSRIFHGNYFVGAIFL